MVISEYTWHVSRVHKRVLKLVIFEVQKGPKTARVRFEDTYPLNQWVVLSGKIVFPHSDQFETHH